MIFFPAVTNTLPPRTKYAIKNRANIGIAGTFPICLSTSPIINITAPIPILTNGLLNENFFSSFSVDFATLLSFGTIVIPSSIESIVSLINGII